MVVVDFTLPWCFLVFVVEVVESLEAFPFESVAVVVVVESVLTFLPWSLVSVLVVVVESVVDRSAFWADSTAAPRREARKSFFINISILRTFRIRASNI